MQHTEAISVFDRYPGLPTDVRRAFNRILDDHNIERTGRMELISERDQLRAELEKVRCELDDAEERASEAEERCAAEWEKDCGQALRILAQVTKFEWDQDGSPADEVREHIQMTLESLEKQVLSLGAELAAAQKRIRELEAQLAETRANLAKADNELNAAAYDLERQGRELADARKDTERLAWCSLHKACAVEYWSGGWRVQNIYQVFMTDSHETPRAAIDAAMKTDWKVPQ